MCWALGFVISALGVTTGQLWLVYLGYGVIGGIGLGIGYISPVSTLIKWFPDRPGLSTGIAIMGFGGGALIGGTTGALIGAIAGGGKGAGIGALIGGGLGTAARVYEKEKEAEVKSGTEFGVILNRAASMPAIRR